MKKTPTSMQPPGLAGDDAFPTGRVAKGSGISAGRYRRERMFDSGDIRLLILRFLAQNPAHGYELIKSIQELSKGEYTPSASIVYPNLIFLEEQGYAEAGVDEAGKKRYAITEEGQLLLDSQRAALEAVIERLQSLAVLSTHRGIPEMQRAINNIRMALNLRLAKENISQKTLYKIIDVLDQAAKDIERS